MVIDLWLQCLHLYCCKSTTIHSNSKCDLIRSLVCCLSRCAISCMAGSSIQWPVFLLAVTTWTILLVSDFAAANITSQCPPGFVPQPHRGNSNRNFSSNPECVCGEWGSERLVQCDEKTLEAFLPIWGCMTYDSESAELLVGKCFYTFVSA